MKLADLVVLFAATTTIAAQDTGPRVSKEVHQALADCLNKAPARLGLSKYKIDPDCDPDVDFEYYAAPGTGGDWKLWDEIARCYERFNVLKNYGLSPGVNVQIIDGNWDVSELPDEDFEPLRELPDIADAGSDPAHWAMTCEADWSAMGGEEARLRNQRYRFPNGLDDNGFEAESSTMSSGASRTPESVSSEATSTPPAQNTFSASRAWDDIELHSQGGRRLNPVDDWLAGRLGAAAAAVGQRGLPTQM